MNSSLSAAKRNKQDEFYTQIQDIEKELVHYREHFKDQIIFCNCDDPEHSNFWWYFKLNFDFLGLKKLITTHFDAAEPTYKLVIDGTKRDKDGNPIERKTTLKGNGDFRSDEAIEILKDADIVVTNPPFSLFREYVAQLVEYNKKFLIIGSQNAVTYKDIFTLIKNNEMWLGNNTGDMKFTVPDDYEPRPTRFWIDEKGQKWRSMGNICWYTNLPHKKRYEDIILVKKYHNNEELYPHYDNYNAINVDKTKDIPEDYKGLMGVPITFLDKYNPEQFDVMGMTKTPICHSNSEEARPIKRYQNGKQHSKDGSIKGGNKVNDGSAILYKEIPTKRPFYTADNTDGYLLAQYPRILIRHKRGVNNEN